MSHVDDGALHAYLDGALDALPATEAARIREHLASCDACARRLEEERAVRAEAHAILGGADPALEDLPSLEEMRALASAGGAHPPAAVRLRRLGWAASIVVAVGAGWMLRGVREPTALAEGGAPAAEPVEERPEARVESAADVASAVDAPAPPAEGGATRQAAEKSAAEETPLAPAPTLALDELVVTASRPDSAVAPEGAPTDSGAAGRNAALVALQDSLLARLGEAKVLPTAERAELQPVAPAPVTRATRLRADAPLQEELSRRRMDPAAEVRAAADVAPLQSFASDALGAVIVPGLPLISVERAPAGLPEGTVRALHRVEADTLEVLRLPPGLDPSSLTLAEGDGRTQVSVRRGDGWLVGRARLSSARIAELLARVPGGR